MTLSLGIDIGTTKIACIVRDCKSGNMLFCKNAEHKAELAPGIQSVKIHYLTLLKLFSEIPDELRSKIASIGVSGQMHGVLCWSDTENTELFTWQSKSKNLSKFQQIDPTLQHGFGITSLAELLENGVDLDKYENSGTIHDYVVYCLTGKKGKSIIDYTNAASWGAYDIRKNIFKKEVIEQLGIPEKILPKIVSAGTCVGKTCNFPYLKDGIQVMAAIGDNQASVFSSLENIDEELFLTIGTGIQLSTVVDRIYEKVELRPFIDNKFLAVAAPLCGGAAWAWLCGFIQDVCKNFCGNELSKEEVYALMDKLALLEFDSKDLPKIMPNFLGERGQSELRGNIQNLTLNNFSIGKISAALALGIVTNLFEMMPQEIWKSKKSLKASGNAIRKSAALQKACFCVSSMNPLILEACEEAAQGAAKLSERLLKS